MKEVRKTRTAPSREEARTATGARRRKRKKRSYTLYYLLLLFFVLISGITLSVTVFFNIETIEVTGNKLHNSEEIIRHSGLEKGNNLFRINTEKAEDKLIAAFQDIDSVTITKKFPSSLIIAVTDANATYYLLDENGFTAVSKGGRVLKKGVPATETKDGTIVIGIDGKNLKLGSYIDKKKNQNYELLETIGKALKAAKLNEITEINIQNDVDLSVCYQNRLIIKLGNISELSYKLNFARNIIETKLTKTDTGIIDASKASKIYYNPASMISSAPASSGQNTSSGLGSSSKAPGTSSVGTTSGGSSQTSASSQET